MICNKLLEMQINHCFICKLFLKKEMSFRQYIIFNLKWLGEESIYEFIHSNILIFLYSAGNVYKYTVHYIFNP